MAANKLTEAGTLFCQQFQTTHVNTGDSLYILSTKHNTDTD